MVPIRAEIPEIGCLAADSSNADKEISGSTRSYQELISSDPLFRRFPVNDIVELPIKRKKVKIYLVLIY